MKLQTTRNLISVLAMVCLAVASTFAQEHGKDHAHGKKHTAAHWAHFLKGAPASFNGMSLDGWRGYKQEEVKGWVAVDDTLHRSDKGGDIMTSKVYKDFVMSTEWKVAKGGNSGIMYRVRQGDGAPYMSGVEYQVLDNDGHSDGKSDLTSAGAIYALYPTDQAVCKPAGEWNKTMIVVIGNHVEHWLNDKLVAETEMWGDDWNKRFKESKFASWTMFGKSSEGHIALQDHGDKVWYRNIVIKPVTEEDTKKWSEMHGDEHGEHGKNSKHDE